MAIDMSRRRGVDRRGSTLDETGGRLYHDFGLVNMVAATGRGRKQIRLPQGSLRAVTMTHGLYLASREKPRYFSIQARKGTTGELLFLRTGNQRHPISWRSEKPCSIILRLKSV